MSARLVFQEGDVAVYDLLGSRDTGRIEAMLGLYEKLFPQYQHYVPRMRRRAEFGNEHRKGHVVHYWLVEVGGQPAGLRTFRYIRQRRCGLAHALAVDSSFRKVEVQGSKLAVFIIHQCLTQVLLDAAEMGDLPPFGIVNEVEPQSLMDHYARNGLVKLPLNYVEPIFPPEEAGRSRAEELALVRFSPMQMGFLPNPHVKIEKYSREMITDFVLAFLVNHYGLPDDNPFVLNVLESIKE